MTDEEAASIPPDIDRWFGSSAWVLAQAVRKKFEHEVDPEGKLSAGERATLGELARQVFYDTLPNPVSWAE